MTEIRLESLSKHYGSGASLVKAVDDVTLRVAPGELFFLLGPSGCGKTTLLRMIAGLIDPTAGRVFLDEKDVTGLAVEDRNTALVFQNYALWPHMTVRQNVEFGPKMRRVPGRERKEIVGENLDRVRMSGYARRKPNQLSGGQQQRVALARALAARPACLLLDEPLSNLDARLRLQMRHELRRLVKQTGTTSVYVTHDQKEALSMADRLAVINLGRVEQIGTPQEVYERPGNRFIADFVGEANFIEGEVTRGGEMVELRTPAGTVRASGTAGVLVGDRAACCVRPEWAALREAGAEGVNCLPATVTGETYLGEVRQYDVELADGTAWRVTALGAGATQHPSGSKVSVCFEPARVCVLTA